MRTRTKALVVTASVLVTVLAAGVASAAGGSRDDPETPISGSALGRATQAALDHTGDGRITDTEVGDEDSYYEVEVTLSDGRQVDVQLDADFRVVGSTADREESSSS